MQSSPIHPSLALLRSGIAFLALLHVAGGAGEAGWGARGEIKPILRHCTAPVPVSQVSASNPLVFLHLPKTAGTTFRNVLYKASDRLHLRDCTVNFLFDDLARSPEKVRRCDVIMGHIPFGVTYGIEAGLYTTILRDPVSRIVSLWDFMQNVGPSHLRYVFFEGQSLSQAIVRSYEMMDESSPGSLVRNDQTWLLCGYLCDRAKMSVWDALEIAKKHLLQHAVVGVMEDMASFKTAFQHYFPGWWEDDEQALSPSSAARRSAMRSGAGSSGVSDDDAATRVGVVNGHSGSHTSLTPEDEMMLKELLRPDIELYRLASVIRMEQARCMDLTPTDPEGARRAYIYL